MNDSVTAWLATLERIEQALAASLARAAEVPPVIPRDGPGPDDPLVRLEQRFGQWRECLQRAERAAGGSEADLDADQQAVAGWMAAAQAARQRLAARPQNGA